MEEFVDQAGAVHRRTRVKLHDKKAALDSLAKHLGMFVDPRIAEQSFEYRVMKMTSEERLAMAAELLAEGRKLLSLMEDSRVSLQEARVKRDRRPLRSKAISERNDGSFLASHVGSAPARRNRPG
jgi:hypothetical protein